MINVAKIILSGMKCSLRNGLADFWGKADGTGLMRDNGTPGAFSKARAKIQPELFDWIAREVADAYSTTQGLRCWQDMHVYGIDGSTLRLPDDPEIRSDFEVEAEEPPLARVSQLVEVHSGLVIDSSIDTMRVGERELALDHLHRLDPGSVVVMDRGYPAGWLFAAFRSAGLHFVARAQKRSFACVDAFFCSDECERTATIHLSSESLAAAAHNEISSVEPVKVRLVKVFLPSGEVEVLITSLLDPSISANSFSPLYRLRWGCETTYRYQKCWAGLEHFTGRTPHSVRQDFFAHVALWNIAAATADRLDDHIQSKPKHVHRINRVSALSIIKNAFVQLLAASLRRRSSLLRNICSMALASTSPVRPDRSFPRGRRKENPFNPIVLAIS